MSSTSVFAIVGKNDNPVYETEFSTSQKNAGHLSQFIIHAALDVVQEQICFVTAGHAKFMLLHEARNEDGIKNFFQDVHELYLKVVMNPFYDVNTPITNTTFDARVKQLAKKHL